MADKTNPLDSTKIIALPQIIRMGSVADRDLTAPPGGEADGDRYIVAAGGSGAWSGKDNQIAEYHQRINDAAATWYFYDPNDGFTVKVVDEAVCVQYDHATTSWIIEGAAGVIKAVSVKTSDYPLTGSDYNVSMDAASNTVTITMPASPETGRVYVIGCEDNTFVADIDLNGKNFYDNAANISLVKGSNIVFQYNGTQWILGG